MLQVVEAFYVVLCGAGSNLSLTRFVCRAPLLALQAAAPTLCQVLFSHAGCVLQLLMLLLL